MPVQFRAVIVTLALFFVALVASNYYLWSQITALEGELAQVREAAVTTGDLDQLRAEVEAAQASANEATAQSAGVENRLDAIFITTGLVLEEVVTQLEALETQSFTINVPIEQEIPVDATIPFDESFAVPVNTNVPINTTVDVPLNLGLLGDVTLDIPINTTVPIDLTVPVRIQKEVPINIVVPINLEVPVTLALADTPLAEQLRTWRGSIEAFLEDLQ